jgi:hypothetical protein
LSFLLAQKRQMPAFREGELRHLTDSLKRKMGMTATAKIWQSGSLKVSYWEKQEVTGVVTSGGTSLKTLSLHPWDT